MSSEQHKPARWSIYQESHRAHMSQLEAAGFVFEDNTLEWGFEAGIVTLMGHIPCRGGIVIEVDKTLQVLDGISPPSGESMVQTVKYAYNAFVQGHGNIFRHDNSHAHKGHPDPHHLHWFDWKTDSDIGPPTWCGTEGWLTLHKFIDVLEEWYFEHRLELPNPDGRPNLAGLLVR